MNKSADTYLACDPWLITEENWHRERNLVSESVFSLGNEYMGVRGYAEEGTGAQTMRGSYFNGIYEEADLSKSYKGIITKTHFMVNAVDWLYTEIRAGNETLDMAACKISGFRRTLDMKRGILLRSFDWHTEEGPVIHIEFTRFLDMENVYTGYQKIAFAVSGGDIKLNAVIANSFGTNHYMHSRNYWNPEKREWFDKSAAILALTPRTGQRIFSGFTWRAEGCTQWKKTGTEKAAGIYAAGIHAAGFEIEITLQEGKEGWIEKSVYNYAVKNRNNGNFVRKTDNEVWEHGIAALENGFPSFETALDNQKIYWEKFWKNADIRIEGDLQNQQGIRFCIFQMHQTYNGYDSDSVNFNCIGAKGLTGEAYNGHTFWDTETYCLPFYIFSNPKAARNLLEFRYATLKEAAERARQLDCRGACYPVATLNGEEGCGLWQHASLQFQASTGVAYGIAHYSGVSGDTEFLYSRGAKMLVEICRFLVSRGSWNTAGTGFGFYAVMGPDEFHMMVNHNCYTNFMAKKTLEYTEKILSEIEKAVPEKYAALCEDTGLCASERENFARCAQKMIILYDKKTKLYEQHESYFSLPHIEISQIPADDFPLYNNWSYDRIYRSDMIKQPDVLMFMFLYNSEFPQDVKRSNYEFYEPKTIHESSLSPSIHSIFASELGKTAEAFRFFEFATRMDLDNYNRNTAEGLHTTSIAAAWMNIVYGFGGLRSDGETLVLNPVLPEQWTEYEFGIFYRNAHIRIKVTKTEVILTSEDKLSNTIPIIIYNKKYILESSDHGGTYLQVKRLGNQ